jgi:hypothetical protein
MFLFHLIRIKPKFLFPLLILILILGQCQYSHAQEEPSELEIRANNEDGVSLQKCSEDVKEDFFLVPEFMQIKFPPEKIEWNKNVKFRGRPFYNFSLSGSGRGMCGGGERFRLEILRRRDDSLPTWFFFDPSGTLNYNRVESAELGLPEQEINYHPNNFCISKYGYG